MAKSENQMKPAPQLPIEIRSWSKQQQHLALLNILSHNLGAAVRSDLLNQQLAACRAGIQTAKDDIVEIETDELATSYQQIYEEEMSSANQILEDHILVFFVACQLYITRVTETVCWFKTLECGSTSGQAEQLPEKIFKLKADIHDSSTLLRQFGTRIAKDMTIAECMWHLGNYAKHNDELGWFRRETRTGLEKLDVCSHDGSVKSDAIRRGLCSVTGPGIDSIAEIESRLEQIASSLKAWAEHLEDRIISDLDDYFFADPTYTKRLNDSFQRMLHSQNLAP